MSGTGKDEPSPRIFRTPEDLTSKVSVNRRLILVGKCSGSELGSRKLNL